MKNDNMNSDKINDEQKAEIIATIITEYEQGREQLPKNVSHKEFQEAHTKMLAKVYDAQFQSQQKQLSDEEIEQ